MVHGVQVLADTLDGGVQGCAIHWLIHACTTVWHMALKLAAKSLWSIKEDWQECRPKWNNHGTPAATNFRLHCSCVAKYELRWLGLL